MTTIKLINGYFVEVDPFNYTLKRKYMVKNKDGIERECTKLIGYYSKLEHVIARVIELEELYHMDGLELEMREYVDMVKKSNRCSVEALMEAFERLD
jgi:hypothetical protein